MKAARKLAQQYILTYSDEIPTSQLVQRVANVMQEYTQSGYAIIFSVEPQFCEVRSVFYFSEKALELCL